MGIMTAGINKDMFDHLKKGGQQGSIRALKNAVERLCLALTQKDGGQRKDGNPDKSVNFASPELDLIQLTILIEAVALVLSGKLDGLEGGEDAESVSENSTKPGNG